MQEIALVPGSTTGTLSSLWVTASIGQHPPQSVAADADFRGSDQFCIGPEADIRAFLCARIEGDCAGCAVAGGAGGSGLDGARAPGPLRPGSDRPFQVVIRRAHAAAIALQRASGGPTALGGLKIPVLPGASAGRRFGVYPSFRPGEAQVRLHPGHLHRA